MGVLISEVGLAIARYIQRLFSDDLNTKDLLDNGVPKEGAKQYGKDLENSKLNVMVETAAELKADVYSTNKTYHSENTSMYRIN